MRVAAWQPCARRACQAGWMAIGGDWPTSATRSRPWASAGSWPPPAPTWQWLLTRPPRGRQRTAAARTPACARARGPSRMRAVSLVEFGARHAPRCARRMAARRFVGMRERPRCTDPPPPRTQRALRAIGAWALRSGLWLLLPGSGRCACVPAQDPAAASARLRSRPLKELDLVVLAARHRLVQQGLRSLAAPRVLPEQGPRHCAPCGVLHGSLETA